MLILMILIILFEFNKCEECEIVINSVPIVCKNGYEADLQFANYTILNSAIGEVAFYVQLRNINDTIDLYVESSEETAEEALFTTFTYITHENCSGVQEIIVRYVFTGRYFFFSHGIISRKMFVETDYKKKETLMTEYYAPGNTKGREKVFTAKTTPANITAVLEGNGYCVKVHTYLHEFKNGSYTQNFKSIGCDFYNITCNCGYEETNRLQLMNHSTFKCAFENLEPGFYNFTFSVFDDVRCVGLNLWYPLGCVWNTNITVTPDHPPNENGLADSTFGIILLILVAILILTGLIVIILFRLWHKRKTGSISIGSSESTDVSLLGMPDETSPPEEIFILYARDGEPQKKIIKMIKTTLKTMGVDRIRDIHDQDEQLLQSPEMWIREKIRNKSICIILFLNKVGSILYQSSSTTYYEKPKWVDSLYIYALNYLQRDYNRNYNNLFLTYFSGDDCDFQAFKCFSPAVRYSLPDSIKLLLEQIFRKKINQDDEIIQKFYWECKEILN